ncbi:DUF805 domain-containing protein [Ensifer soli]|uniref:DUF805 domain-containing protein n=1 Tax=Ciceribacter sp. sgz301302 TaxID=3342379 RepID=UPI0035B71BE9
MLRLFFHPAGRIGRQLFTLLWLFWLAVLFANVALVAANEANEVRLVGYTLLLFVTSLAGTASLLTATLKRLRDVGLPPVLLIALFIPVAAPLLVGTLCLWPGRPEDG